jgi:hypothetical protein
MRSFWVRRLSRLARECLCFGLGMVTPYFRSIPIIIQRLPDSRSFSFIVRNT